MMFSKGKIRKLPTLKLNHTELEVVFYYPYLGIIANYNGKFMVAQKDLYDKAHRAMFGIISKCRRLRLPLDIQLKLFDSLVKLVMLYDCEVWGPYSSDLTNKLVMLYGCEVWGPYWYSSDLANKLQLRFWKLTIGLRKSTTTVMVRGETGSYPIINVQVNMYMYLKSTK